MPPQQAMLMVLQRATLIPRLQTNLTLQPLRLLGKSSRLLK